MASMTLAQEAPSRIAISLSDGFPAVYRRFRSRFRPFIWRGQVQSPRRINHLAIPPLFSPFKNGENGAASNRRRDSTRIHPALGVALAADQAAGQRPGRLSVPIDNGAGDDSRGEAIRPLDQ